MLLLTWENCSPPAVPSLSSLPSHANCTRTRMHTPVHRRPMKPTAAGSRATSSHAPCRGPSLPSHQPAPDSQPSISQKARQHCRKPTGRKQKSDISTQPSAGQFSIYGAARKHSRQERMRKKKAGLAVPPWLGLLNNLHLHPSSSLEPDRLRFRLSFSHHHEHERRCSQFRSLSPETPTPPSRKEERGGKRSCQCRKTPPSSHRSTTPSGSAVPLDLLLPLILVEVLLALLSPLICIGGILSLRCPLDPAVALPTWSVRRIYLCRPLLLLLLIHSSSLTRSSQPNPPAGTCTLSTSSSSYILYSDLSSFPSIPLHLAHFPIPPAQLPVQSDSSFNHHHPPPPPNHLIMF